MAHWLAWKLGVISKAQAYELQGYKLSDPKTYEFLEHEWGADRASLEKKFGKKFVEDFEKLNAQRVRLEFRTSSKSGKKYPVRVQK